MARRSLSKVEEVYHAALARPPNERGTFLKHACGGDEGLLGEVKSLLGYEEEARRLLEEPVAEAATQKLAAVRGARLGPYEVLGLLGAGGMGEVYRARDTRLGRDVAVKVLPEHVAHDPEALGRFAQETRALASLNHPHICALYDVGREGGIDFAVTELLEGETLRERLSRGALSPTKAIELTVQTCHGLAAAHAKGIVHRDLKPENLFLTREGLKILDFGLAKRTTGIEGAEATTPRTRSGLLLGTVGYLSPEQARGEPADARSDVFAVGVVLYEMLSGRRAFKRDTHAETLTAILKEDPPELASPTGSVPPALERIVRRCLEKDPEDRFQSVRDVGFALDATSGTSGVPGQESEVPRWPRRARGTTIAAMVAVALAALSAAVLVDRLWLRTPASAPGARVVRSQIDLTPDSPLFGLYPHQIPFRRELDLSPDGTLLVWSGRQGNDHPSLHLRRLASGEVTRIAEAGDKTGQPFFSPDGRWIGFLAAQGRGQFRLRKVPAEGGLAVDLAEISGNPMGATWGPDGRIYVGSETQGLRWVPAEGGPLSEITTVDRTREVGHRLPSVLPGGRALLFTTMPFKWGVQARIEAVSLATGKRTVVVEDAADARYLPTGRLVFVRQGVLMATPFDLSRLEPTAPPVPVLEGISQALNWGYDDLNSGAAQFSVSDSGLLAYAPGGIVADTPVELVLVDEQGRTEALPGFNRPLVSPQLHFSPDGRQLAFTEQHRRGLLSLFDVERQTYRALSDRGIAGSPRWSPDGTRLAAGWSEAGPTQLWIVPTGRGDWERLTAGEDMQWSPSWSPDGRTLAFVRLGSSSTDILLYRFEDRQAVPFLDSPAMELYPEFSPDGRWLAYASDESGRFEVYVTSFPEREHTLTVSRQGGQAPAWSRDGSRLFYYSPSSRDDTPSMMAVAVRSGPELSLGMPTALFRLPDRFVSLGTRAYELHPDGQRFLVGRFVKTDPPPPITRLTLVHNWFAELERLCPTGRSHPMPGTTR
jgi:serine/threonine protein kinase/Tol biopolymer transport system component